MNALVIVPALMAIGSLLVLALFAAVSDFDAENEQAYEARFGRGLHALGKATRNGTTPGCDPGVGQTSRRVRSSAAHRN